MDLRQLRCFVAVAQELHFGRAAARLHLTTSPVSRGVRELEQELRAELFVRRYHAVELTPAGKALLEPAQQILDRVGQLPAIVAASDPGAGVGVLRIGGAALAPPSLVDSVIAAATAVCSGAGVEPVVASSAQLLPALEAGELHLVIVHLPLGRPALASLLLAEYRFSVVMSADDASAGRESVTLADLADRTFALPPASLQPVLMARLRHYLERQGITRFFQPADGDLSLIAGCVRRSRGGMVTLATSPVHGGGKVFDDPAFALVPLDDDELRLAVGLAWRRDDEPRGALASVIADTVCGQSPPRRPAP